MTNISIRLRLTLWYSAVLLFGLGVFGFGMWLALDQRLLAGADTRLAQRMRGLQSSLGAEAGIHDRAQLRQELEEFASETGDGMLVQLRDGAGAMLAANPMPAFAASAPASRPTSYTVYLDGKPFRVLTQPMRSAGESFEALVAAPLDEMNSVMRDFRRLLFLMIPAVLLLGGAGGYWLSLRALAPVDQITAAARCISLTSLSKRIVVPHTGDELQRMSETWNDVLERLDAAVQRVKQFTADASHELRTPLALIRTTAELALRREREPEEYRTALRAIENQSEQMTDLTGALLTIARADFEGLSMPVSPTGINELVSEAVEENRALALEKGIRMNAVVDGAPVVRANAEGIQRLLRILIDNALKHTPEGGAVTVSAARRENGVVVSVADTGEGISAVDLPHIFERFYRGDPARGSGAGFGLGLSIAQAIAQAHGSEIGVVSRLGCGACFSVVLRG